MVLYIVRHGIAAARGTDGVLEEERPPSWQCCNLNIIDVEVRVLGNEAEAYADVSGVRCGTDVNGFELPIPSVFARVC